MSKLFYLPFLFIFSCTGSTPEKEIREHPFPPLCTDSATDAVRVRVIGNHWAYSDLSKTEMGIDCVVLHTIKGSSIKENDTAIFYQTQYYPDSTGNKIEPGKEFSFCLRERRNSDVVHVDSSFVHLTGGADTSEFEGLPWIIPKRKYYVVLNKFEW